jgi:tRNA dimethylallyltransferase
MNKNCAKYLIVVVGPTAIGKTALAIKIAQHFGSNIISADSRQFFKEMAIGTAVPSNEELAAAPHHFIQHISINDTYSVGDFERDALQKLDMLFKQNNLQVMVGGSGLYVDAILNGFDDFPDIDPEIRTRLISGYDAQGIEYLQEQLKELDPVHYERVALQNPQRLMRALEVSIGTGRPYSSFLGNKKSVRNFFPIVIGLEAEREVIYERINTRVDAMVENGLIDEATKLYPYRQLNALQTVGYRELFSHFDGEMELNTAIEEIKKNTRRFAKRQMTWFRRNESIQWFNYATNMDEIINYINLNK